MSIRDIRPSEDVPRLLDNVNLVIDGIDDAGLWHHLKKDGTRIDVRIVSNTIDYAGHRAEAVLATDVTDQLRAQREVHDYIRKIERSSAGVIMALGSIVELRDPYTAGHQRRVADICTAIASEMKLPPFELSSCDRQHCPSGRRAFSKPPCREQGSIRP